MTILRRPHATRICHPSFGGPNVNRLLNWNRIDDCASPHVADVAKCRCTANPQLRSVIMATVVQPRFLLRLSLAPAECRFRIRRRRWHFGQRQSNNVETCDESETRAVLETSRGQQPFKRTASSVRVRLSKLLSIYKINFSNYHQLHARNRPRSGDERHAVSLLNNYEASTAVYQKIDHSSDKINFPANGHTWVPHKSALHQLPSANVRH